MENSSFVNTQMKLSLFWVLAEIPVRKREVGMGKKNLQQF
jgi:hypothetical protein